MRFRRPAFAIFSLAINQGVDPRGFFPVTALALFFRFVHHGSDASPEVNSSRIIDTQIQLLIALTVLIFPLSSQNNHHGFVCQQNRINAKLEISRNHHECAQCRTSSRNGNCRSPLMGSPLTPTGIDCTFSGNINFLQHNLARSCAIWTKRRMSIRNNFVTEIADHHFVREHFIAH